MLSGKVHVRLRRGLKSLSQSQRSELRALSTGAEKRFGLQGDKYDVVLSSGFLAFANHSGFLRAVDEAGMQVSGVMGTSAGALAGGLYCAGYTPQQVAYELSRDPPISLLQLSSSPWRGGVLSLERVVERLRNLLPARFEDLKVDFAVGVVTSSGQHQLIDSGPLPEAIAASAAIPFIFESVDIPGRNGRNPYKDGGMVDRVGLRAWRDRRRTQALAAGNNPARVPPALVHVISRSSPFSGFDDVDHMGEPHVTIVHSPKSGVNFFSLGDFETHMGESMRRAQPLLAQALLAGQVPGGSRGQLLGGSTAAGLGRQGADQRSPERRRGLARTRATNL